jgi:hypothetical protein
MGRPLLLVVVLLAASCGDSRVTERAQGQVRFSGGEGTFQQCGSDPWALDLAVLRNGGPTGWSQVVAVLGPPRGCTDAATCPTQAWIDALVTITSGGSYGRLGKYDHNVTVREVYVAMTNVPDGCALPAVAP